MKSLMGYFGVSGATQSSTKYLSECILYPSHTPQNHLKDLKIVRYRLNYRIPIEVYGGYLSKTSLEKRVSDDFDLCPLMHQIVILSQP